MDVVIPSEIWPNLPRYFSWIKTEATEWEKHAGADRSKNLNQRQI